MTDITVFVKERDAAFIDFVKTGHTKKLKAYCEKYGVEIPKDKEIMAAGVYKAVQQCTSIPEDIKEMAFIKCIKLGFSPLIRYLEGDDLL